MTYRIAVDVRMHAHSGIGTYITNLVPLLVQARPEWQFHLLGPERDLSAYPWTSAPGVSIHSLDVPIYSIAEQYHVIASMREPVDLLWVPHYNIPVAWRGRLLVTIHDLYHLPGSGGGLSLSKRTYARAMFRVVRRRADTILCVSNFTRTEFDRLVGTRVPAPRAVHIGVDPSWFAIEAGPPPRSGPFLVFVGNVKPNKNITALLRAFREVMHQLPHDLVIIGKRDGFLVGDSTVAAEALPLGDRVQFTGAVDKATLQQFIAHADALVFPSLYEGFGLPPLEAMAAGCPVAASTAASIPEVCGDAALYFDPRDPSDIARKIALLCQNAELRSELIRRGKARARTFTWERCARETLAAIEATLDD